MNEPRDAGLRALRPALYHRFHRLLPFVAHPVARRVWAVFGWMLAAAFFAFCGLILFLRHSVLPNIETHRPRLEQLASEGLGLPVHIGGIAAGWQGLNPDLTLAEQNGFDPTRDNFFIRCVSWQASHDLGEQGWSESLLGDLVEWLAARGKVHISSEAPLLERFAAHAYQGKVSAVHHLMAHCRLFIGESATMASECAVLGVPAIYAAHTGRGYTDEQEQRYGLVTNLRQFDLDRLRRTIEPLLARPAADYQARRQDLLADTIDVAAFVAEQIEQTAGIR